MAIECTDPGRWGNVPGFDADEETVERYLVHLDECEYHARLENQEDERLASAAGMARAQVRSSAIVLPGPVAERVHQQRTTRLGELRAAAICELSIRVDGVEKARATAERGSAAEVQAPEGAVVSVWGIATDSNVFLSSFIVGGKRRTESTTLLAGGQTLAFQVDPRSSAPARVSVAFAPAVVTKAQPATRAGVLERLSAAMASSGRWAPVYGLAAAALAIAVVAPIYIMQNDANEPERVGVAPPRPTPPRDTDETTGPDNVNRPPQTDIGTGGFALPSGATTTATNSGTSTSTTPRRPGASKPPGRRVPPPPVVNSVTEVSRVYIEGPRELRAAIAKELRATGEFTVVEHERNAHATIRLSQMRGIEQRIAVSLDKGQENIWNGEDIVIGSGEDGTEKAAASFVEEFLKATRKPEVEKATEPTAPEQK
jgi:hypothetical protein